MAPCDAARVRCVGLLLLIAACGSEPGPPPDAARWSFAVLPDTQIAVRDHPELVVAQTEWLAAEAQTDLRFVLHVGDITDHNDDREWDLAEAALRRMDGRVPYVLIPGNHDYGEGGSAFDRTTQLGARFPLEQWEAQPSFGGASRVDRPDSTYHVFETPEGPWLVVALEFAPTEETVAWAAGVLQRHAALPAILLTHAYLYFDDTRYDEAIEGQRWAPGSYVLARDERVYDGQALYDALVEPHPNVALVFCGHTLGDGVARISTRRGDGTYVHEVLANYQHQPNGGDGYLRVVEVSPEEFRIRTYSPPLGRARRDADNEFVLPRAE